MFGLWPRKTKQQKARARRAADDEKLGEIPRSPPFAKGIPLCSIERLLDDQSDILRLLRYEIPLSGSEYEHIFDPVIRRYAEYVHLLPASEAHHHRDAGGLLRHGFEVAQMAARFSKGCMWDARLYPEDRLARSKSWKMCAAVAGLLHDIGKIDSDIAVVTEDGKNIWNPAEGTLFKWGKAYEVERYFIRFKPKRYGFHTELYHGLAEYIIRGPFYRWLGQQPTDVKAAFWAAIAGKQRVTPSLEEKLKKTGQFDNLPITNELMEIVHKADCHSVEAYGVMKGETIDPGLGVPVSGLVIDTLRELVSAGEQRWNVKGCALWHLRVDNEEAAYLVWPAMAHHIIHKAQQLRLSGVSQNPKDLLQVMIDHGTIVKNTAGEWIFDILIDGMKKPLTFVKLKNAAIINTRPLGVVEAKFVRPDPEDGAEDALAQTVPAVVQSPAEPAETSNVVAFVRLTPKTKNGDLEESAQPVLDLSASGDTARQAPADPPPGADGETEPSDTVSKKPASASEKKLSVGQKTHADPALPKQHHCPGCRSILDDVHLGRCGKCGRSFDPKSILDEDNSPVTEPAAAAPSSAAQPPDSAKTPKVRETHKSSPSSEQTEPEEGEDDSMPNGDQTGHLWQAIKNSNLDVSEFLKIKESLVYFRYPLFLQRLWNAKNCERGREKTIEWGIITAEPPDPEGWIPASKGISDVIIPLIEFISKTTDSPDRPRDSDMMFINLLAVNEVRQMTIPHPQFNGFAQKLGITGGSLSDELRKSTLLSIKNVKNGYFVEMRSKS